METIYIQHPLRDITYKSKAKHYFMESERQDLIAYRTAHDEAWRMKQHFQKVKGDVLVVRNELYDLDYERRELERMRTYYLSQIDPAHIDNTDKIDIHLHVELRDFYLQVQKLHHQVIKFYDKVAVLEAEYHKLIDIHFRSEKPIDPLNFHVLDNIFTFYEDRDTDIKSLDKDLQEFFQELTAVYALLEDYVKLYTAFSQDYHTSLKEIANLMESCEDLHKIWE